DYIDEENGYRYYSNSQIWDLFFIITLKEAGFSLEEIKNGKNVLVKDTDYTIAGDVITIKNEYLKKFKEKQVIVFKMNAGENPTLNIDVVNTDPNILIMKDFAELELPAYNLIDGSTIVATGVNGTDFTVTSESSLIRITRETINGVLVNMIHYTRPQTSQIVTMTVSGNLGGISTPYSYKYAIKGTGGGSSGGGGGGSTGGGSNNNNSHKNPGSGTISFNDGMNTPENPDVIPPKDDIFSDLGDAEWAKIYIEALAKNQIVSGDEDGKFNPNNQITREEFVKMLVGSMDIEPINSASLPFDDVKTDDWAYAYIAAAYEKGLINGVDENNFGMGNFISRQDIAVILNRAIKDINPNKVVEDTTFSDDNNAEEYAKESIKNIVGYGIMGGYPDGTFMPKNTITRAETAKVLSKIIDLKGAK
ncbi:MAG: S-layer homology domain-containing protein, partial [Oscillospiraceae bacterium]